jgi:hypothetical protein
MLDETFGELDGEEEIGISEDDEESGDDEEEDDEEGGGEEEDDDCTGGTDEEEEDDDDDSDDNNDGDDDDDDDDWPCITDEEDDDETGEDDPVVVDDEDGSEGEGEGEGEDDIGGIGIEQEKHGMTRVLPVVLYTIRSLQPSPLMSAMSTPPKHGMVGMINDLKLVEPFARRSNKVLSAVHIARSDLSLLPLSPAMRPVARAPVFGVPVQIVVPTKLACSNQPVAGLTNRTILVEVDTSSSVWLMKAESSAAVVSVREVVPDVGAASLRMPMSCAVVVQPTKSRLPATLAHDSVPHVTSC